jgi:hypothetical protein
MRLSVQIFRSGETTSLWGRSNELGEDGVGGTMTGELQVGEVVSMELALPLATCFAGFVKCWRPGSSGVSIHLVPLFPPRITSVTFE